jgi:hypothetical protein
MPGMLVWRRSSTLRAMPRGVLTVARPSDSCRLADGLLRGWANRMSTATLRGGIEIDGGDMALVMGDLVIRPSTTGMLRRARSARISGGMS